jgi:hypothetical protein
MARKPKPATKPVPQIKKSKRRSKRRQRKPKMAWWDVALDYIGSFILLVLVSGLILWLAYLFRAMFDPSVPR